jgi:Sec7-like guanine-nucleotide exchange factor
MSNRSTFISEIALIISLCENDFNENHDDFFSSIFFIIIEFENSSADSSAIFSYDCL